MEPVGIALFAGFGLLIGVLFGFFGMGGSILVTPALLVVGYPAPVAVGSGLAFVFGTSVVGALSHRARGQIDSVLAAVMTLGMTIGVEAGTRVVFRLERYGSVDLAVSAAYVVLLALVGAITLDDALRDHDEPRWSDLVAPVRSIRLPPTLALADDVVVSAWLVLAVGIGIGTLSGILGVGGGFLLLPAMTYGFGVPVAVAVGTDVLQIAVSSAYGAFVYAGADAVALQAVGPMLAGSALGARVGAGATDLVSEDDVKGCFAATLLAGSLSVAAKGLGDFFGLDALEAIGLVLLFGTPVFACAVIAFAAGRALQERVPVGTTATR